MKIIYTAFSMVTLFALTACGGSGSSVSPKVTASKTGVTLSGKQFSDNTPTERIDFTFDPTEISAVNVSIEGSVFKIDARDDHVIVFSNDRSLDGGTYEEDLILDPIPRTTGKVFPKTIIPVTLIQEPTAPIIVELNPSFDDTPIVFVKGGPPITVSATLTTGSTINWEAQYTHFETPDFILGDIHGLNRYSPYEDRAILTSNKAEGVGSEQIQLTLDPRPWIIERFENGRGLTEDNAVVLFRDKDNVYNFTYFYVTFELQE